MKVTLLYSKYFSDPTGASAVMRFLNQGQELFRKNGVEISFYSRDTILPKNNSISEDKRNDSNKSVKGCIMSFLRKQSKKNPFAALLHKYIRSGRAAKTLINRYRKEDFQDDIVFIHELDTCYNFLKTRKKDDKTKVVLVLHENGVINGMMLLEYPSLKRSLFYKLIQNKSNYVLNNVDKLGFVSETSMNNFISNNSAYNRDKLFYNLNGIPSVAIPSMAFHHKNTINLCCVGTVNERKGQRYIVEALSQLPLAEREKIHIDIVGDGENKEELVLFCQQNNLLKYISFLGKRTDIVDILSNNDVFILPSQNEGLPISILEAMRQGLPIVSTKVGGIPEMIEDGKTGLLIEPTTASVLQLFKKISNYDWEKMGQESKKLYEKKFSLQSMVDKYSSIFHDVMNEE